MNNLRNYISIKIHFNTVNGLRLCFSHILEHLRQLKTQPTELELKVHWKPETLHPEYQVAFEGEIQKLSNQYKRLSLVYSWPLCLRQPELTSTFPDCESCPQWNSLNCHWPDQVNAEYYVAKQPAFNPNDFESINIDSFSKRRPITWFTPRRSEICLISKYLKHANHVIDFGCGNGFIDYLLLRENKNLKIIGYDPLLSASLNMENFEFTKSLPKGCLDDLAVISSLADYNIPFEKIFTEHTPSVLVFIALTELFGNPGIKSALFCDENGLTVTSDKPLFSFSSIKDRGYSLVEEHPMQSIHSSNIKLLIYTLDGIRLDTNDIESTPYHWENTSASKKETTSS